MLGGNIRHWCWRSRCRGGKHGQEHSRELYDPAKDLVFVGGEEKQWNVLKRSVTGAQEHFHVGGNNFTSETGNTAFIKQKSRRKYEVCKKRRRSTRERRTRHKNLAVRPLLDKHFFYFVSISLDFFLFRFLLSTWPQPTMGTFQCLRLIMNQKRNAPNVKYVLCRVIITALVCSQFWALPLPWQPSQQR